MKPVSESITHTEARPVFQCSGCGHCCSMWRVPIDAYRAHALLKRPWAQEHLQRSGLSLATLPNNEGYLLPLKEGNTCAFLDEEQRCLIQTHEGSAAKPLDCQRFPFAVTVARDAEWQEPFYDVTAACSTIAETLMLSFQEVQPGPKEQEAMEAATEGSPSARKKLSVFVRPKRVAVWPAPFSWFKPLPWNVYEQLCKQLGFFFQQHPLSFWKAIKLGASLLQRPSQAWASLLEQAKSEKRPTQPSTETIGIMEKCLRLCFLRRPYGWLSFWHMLWSGLYRDPRLFGDSAVSLRLVNRYPWPGQHNKQLNAFLLILLRRRIAIANGQSLLGQLSLALVALCLVRFYSAFLATMEEADAIEQSHVVIAIRLVERYYSAHQPAWLALFSLHPACSWLALLALA